MTADLRRSPLAGLADDLAGVATRSRGRLRIAELPYVCQLSVRAGADSVAAAARTLGVSLPITPNTVNRAGDRAALWLGPDEWLVLGAEVPEAEQTRWGCVDVSAQRTTIVLSGPAGRGLLAHGCALDLDRMHAEWCAQTMLARANVLLWGHPPDEVRILVRASFGRYLAAWLLDAATELRNDGYG